MEEEVRVARLRREPNEEIVRKAEQQLLREQWEADLAQKEAEERLLLMHEQHEPETEQERCRAEQEAVERRRQM